MVSTRQSSNMGSSSGRVTEPVEAGPSRRHHAQASSATSSNSEPAPSRQINLLDLPPEILEKITSYLSYNTVAHLRSVCHQMNSMCGAILNSTFQKLQAQMLSRFQAIKAQMPRRESARRNHPLACESDIIETLHMRLTLLQMSFGKHIERKHCCFFPGEILDEVYRILYYIRVTPKLAKPYKVTDELFDLSTMAMEYFKERIEPTLPEISYFSADFFDFAGTFASTTSVSKQFICLDSAPLNGDTSKSSNSSVECSPRHSTDEQAGLLDNSVPPQSNMVLRKRIRKIKQGMKRYNSQLTLMRRDLRTCKAKIAEQQKQILEYATRLDDNDKKNEETSRKFSTLLQELNKCKTELQYWRSKSPAIPVCNRCGQSIPMPTDDLQALANQGVLSEPFGEPLNFIPIPDLDSPTESTSQSTQQSQQQQQQQDQEQSEQQQQQQQQLQQIQQPQQQPISSPPSPQQQQLLPQQSQPQTQSQVKVISLEMAPPKAPLSSVVAKRKSTEDPSSLDATKKSRRTAKSRQAKRSKI